MASEARFPTWAWWIIGVVTMLALSILIFSVVLGIRAGQQQIELQERQQVGIALQQAIDFQAEGNLQAAFDRYQRVLLLDPSNSVAQQGIKNLLTLAVAGTPVAVASPPAVDGASAATAAATVTQSTPVPAVSTPVMPTATTSVTVRSSAANVKTDQLWADAQRAVKAGLWQEALTALTTIQQIDPTYRGQESNDLLFSVYVNLALEKDNFDALEEALQLYDKALRLRPTAADIQQERNLIALYLDVLTYSDVDWPRATAILEELYATDPQYRDVEQRLVEAHTAYAEQLVRDEQWCDAAEAYAAAAVIDREPTLAQRRDAAQAQCAAVTGTTATGTTVFTATGTPMVETAPIVEAPVAEDVTTGGPSSGRIFYSAVDPVSLRNQVLVQAVGKATPAQLILQDATQSALRADGARMAFRNLRGNMGGLSGFDPATGLMLRFSEYAEDTLPSWNAQGSRIAFASNREGDRRWRVYSMWAEENGATDTLGFGEAPAWHPFLDQIAYRGCDESGNACGIWTMSGSGVNRAPLTTIAEDTRPAWSPDGSFVVFMSAGRDGNFEIYRIDVATRTVKRLTDSPAMDGLPTVSPDGAWVAFVSNRDGAWKLWATPSNGGPATAIAPIAGDLGDWLQQALQWVD